MGHQVSVAENGLIAVERCANQDFDAILMDLQMPEMDGFEATEAILKNNPDAVIIGLTASATPETIQECKDAGMRDVVTKPIILAELERSLREIWWQRQNQATESA